jgi:hypothetical protein
MTENEVGGLDEDEIACGQKRSPMIGCCWSSRLAWLAELENFAETESRKSPVVKVV